jgi:hypothetical protein
MVKTTLFDLTNNWEHSIKEAFMKFAKKTDSFVQTSYIRTAAMVEVVLRYDTDKKKPLVDWLNNMITTLGLVENMFAKSLQSIFSDLMIEETSQVHSALKTIHDGSLSKAGFSVEDASFELSKFIYSNDSNRKFELGRREIERCFEEKKDLITGLDQYA